MPRRSGGGGARTAPRAAPARAPPAPAAPARAAAPPPPPPPAPMPAAAPPAPMGGGGMMSGLMGSMASGMAMGTGMAVANRAVDSVLGPRQTEVVHRHEGGDAAHPAAAPTPAPAADTQKCFNEKSWMEQCMQQSNGDIQNCNYYADLLKQCQAA